ncbi:MAG: hypothetical protein JSW41_03970 [Candidatus Aenigmatarchaeota archaeon]|nr:MAG: hypothetical protein JSW41_03970 [Candidatus Aenigmarchaeota archaeon]
MNEQEKKIMDRMYHAIDEKEKEIEELKKNLALYESLYKVHYNRDKAMTEKIDKLIKHYELIVEPLRLEAYNQLLEDLKSLKGDVKK